MMSTAMICCVWLLPKNIANSVVLVIGAGTGGARGAQAPPDFWFIDIFHSTTNINKKMNNTLHAYGMSVPPPPI